MTQNGDPMPTPEPIWVALAIVVWAMAEALGPQRRTRFVKALDRLADGRAEPRRIVSFVKPTRGRREMTQAARIAGAWIARIVAELRAARR